MLPLICLAGIRECHYYKTAVLLLSHLWCVRVFTLQDAIERGWFRKNRSLSGEADMLAIITTAQEVVSALAYMHERDIIHGDVRGANIMLCSSTANARGFTAQVKFMVFPAGIQTACRPAVLDMLCQVACVPSEVSLYANFICCCAVLCCAVLNMFC